MTKANAPKAPWVKPDPETLVEDTSEQIVGEHVHRSSDTARNPFLPPLLDPKPEAIVNEPDADTPSWFDFVQFCTKNAKQITHGRYPSPHGTCIDTIYKGIAIEDHPDVMVRHITSGWIMWKLATAE